MKWNDVRALYPNQWVKLRILNSHKDNGYLYIDDMEILKIISDDKEATLELTHSTGNSIVFHTSHDVIKTKLIKNLGLFRRISN
ncbi:MAG: hypothetical protein N4A57_10970 [Anaeromicrobium sp.]|jgi:hypothetical protein|uniref:hypothetical protein n=1 Tax=Anaeromicrobium sp. TaxID=1929132 RepID=UPI0025CCA39D|nr:hypothetical protein [Anaeromicrobium sp.]MCT4594773.1 hypothetical protein [Anaeromicrobium sp.]